MPGRTSVRSSQRGTAAATSVPTKTSSQPTKTRTHSTRSSAQAVQAPEEGDSTPLRERVCAIFADAQRSPATHRKSAVSLRKIQELCCYETEGQPSSRVFDEDYDESDFNNEFGRCVLRVLGVKKSEAIGDRMVRFIGLFLKHASEKDNAIFQAEEPENGGTFLETPTSRLTTHVLSISLQVIAAKDKVIRYRATQIIAHIVNTLDSIDDEVFQLVRLALLKRLRDKESNVRVQAVLGLGRLADEGEQDEDDDDSDDDIAGGILNKLRDALQNDPSADVRRALLLNLPFTPGTLPYLLERARDLDAATRRALYSRLLPALGDFRHLSLTHREKLLRWGLRDRDENVRKATARLFRERWIEDCAKTGQQENAEGGATQGHAAAAEPSIEALLELLERIDMLNSGVETGIAHEAMREFWDGRPDYRDYVTFEDPFFHELTPESVFVARSFNEFCKKSGDAKLQSAAEDKMPEVTKFAFLVQKHLGKLIELVEEVALNPENTEAEEDAVQQEFCVEQLLHIVLTLDYSDEMGRRKMFSIMREALALAELPEECTKLVVECLRITCGKDAAGEQEFCSIVLEAVAEVHDTIMGEDGVAAADDVDDSFHSAQSEISGQSTPRGGANGRSKGRQADSEVDEDKAIREIMVNMKCLHIAQCMLQNVQCDLEQNSHLVTMLNNLVVPAVRSQEAPVRERGLICLGLCCLLSKNLAAENLVLFLHCYNKGHATLQVIAIQIITDILTAHPSLLVDSSSTKGTNENEEAAQNELVKPVYKLYLKSLRAPEPSVQSTGCTALAKLMLANTIRDGDLLRSMVLSYFDPETQSNPSLRQALTYFLPVYCHSRRRNAVALAQVTVQVLRALSEKQEDLADEGLDEMVGLPSIAAQIVDWTDPRKAVDVATLGMTQVLDEDLDGHVTLAEDLLEKALTPGCSKEDKKLFISTLGKLHISSATPSAILQTLADLVNEALEGRIASDATARNTLTKMQNSLSKSLASVTEIAMLSSKDTTVGADTATQDADIPIQSTEIAEEEPSRIEIPVRTSRPVAAVDDSLDATENQDEEDGSETEVDIANATMMTRFTAPPDAEGTIFGDFEDDEEEGEGQKQTEDVEHQETDELSMIEETTPKPAARTTAKKASAGCSGGGRQSIRRSRAVVPRASVGDSSLLDSLLDDDEDPDRIE